MCRCQINTGVTPAPQVSLEHGMAPPPSLLLSALIHPFPTVRSRSSSGPGHFFFSPFCLHTFNTPQPFTASCLWPMATATEKLFLPGHPVPFPRQDPPYPPCIRSSTDKQCLVMPRFVLNRYSQIQPQLPHPTFKLSRLFQHIQRNLL